MRVLNHNELEAVQGGSKLKLLLKLLKRVAEAGAMRGLGPNRYTGGFHG